MWRKEKSTEGQTSTDLCFISVWPNSILSSVKTHETHSEKQDSLVWWSIMFEGNQLWNHPKVKCAGGTSCCGTERLVRVEEELNAPKDWDYNENPVQSIQNLRLGRRFTFEHDSDPKHTASVAYTQLCECLWEAQPQPELEHSQIFLEKPENVRLSPSSPKELERWRGEEKNGR